MLGSGGTDGTQGPPEERANVTRLLRWIAVFIAFPSLTIGLAFLVFTDPGEHWLHIAGLIPLGIGALVVFAVAPNLARKWYPQD